MATVTFTYDHARDPMHPGDLADKIAVAIGVTTPNVDISPTQIIVTGTGVTEAGRTAMQAVISAYVIDPVRAKSATAEEARLKNGYAALRQWSVDAQTEVAAWDAQTAAQRNVALKELFNRFGKLCDGLADLVKREGFDQ